MLQVLHHDFETASEVDIRIVGLDNYLSHPSTRVLMLAYAIDGGPVELWEPSLGPMPKKLQEMLDDIGITKSCWEARFEHGVFNKVLKYRMPWEYFHDPSVQSRMLSMPGSLEDVCDILGLPPELKKDSRGEELIKLFCMPAGLGGEETLFGITETWFRDASTHPREWEEFKKYCIQDVIAEREIYKKLEKFPLPPMEYSGWVLDHEINERGLPVDLELVRGATAIAAWEKGRLREKLDKMTGLANCNSRDQMLGWVREHGYPFNSLAKPLVKRALGGDGKLDEEGREALILRGQLAKTSDSKYEAVAHHVSSDGRLRHQYVFMGAAKTGRWASFNVQLANLPRPAKEVEGRLDLAIQLLKNEDQIGLDLEFPNILDVVSSCVRSMFRAEPGRRFIVGDLSAIENRMIGWLSGCESILDVFRRGQDPYLVFAAQLYGRSYEDLTEKYNSGDPKVKEMRQHAKAATLGCGYRLSAGEEVINSDGDKVLTGLLGYASSMSIEMTQDQAKEAVKVWRDTYREVVSFWYGLESAAKESMMTGGETEVGRVRFKSYGTKMLAMKLPSGRSLHYIHPRVEMVEFRNTEKESLTYEGINPKTKVWERMSTHGGRLLENSSQAASRDVLLHGMLKAKELGFSICGHVHDEIITEVPYNSDLTSQQLKECMSLSPSWGKDLPLAAECFESESYRKG